jgi:glutamate-5-semialdehyde dehydrogenase
LGKVLEERKVPIGLQIQRVSVPLGIVGMIYESRPNVTVDAFALCFKSGNGCVLKGGSDAKRSNQILVKIIQQVLGKNGFSPNLVYLLPPERESVNQLFSAHNLVDVIIPRGSQSLINFVRENSKIPVIETGAGVCHVFVDESADLAKAQRIVTNSKVSRPFACNALDTLLVHQDRLTDLPKICAELLKSDVTIRVRPQAWEVLSKHYPKNLLKSAETEDYGREFLGYAMALQVVQNLDAALSHIQQFSSGHSESIVSENQTNIDRFLKEVDAAAVYANTSLAFTDGGEFGLGAEIGISTQKLHARGPFALEALTSYKWIVRSNGAVR